MSSQALPEKQWFKEEPMCGTKFTKAFPKVIFCKPCQQCLQQLRPTPRFVSITHMSIRRQLVRKPSARGRVCITSANKRRVEEEEGENVSWMSQYRLIWNLFPVLCFYIRWPLVWFRYLKKTQAGFDFDKFRRSLKKKQKTNFGLDMEIVNEQIILNQIQSNF